jgi:hypothetical protein
LVDVIKFKESVASTSVKTSKIYSVEVVSGIMEVNVRVIVSVSSTMPLVWVEVIVKIPNVGVPLNFVIVVVLCEIVNWNVVKLIVFEV